MYDPAVADFIEMEPESASQHGPCGWPAMSEPVSATGGSERWHESLALLPAIEMASFPSLADLTAVPATPLS